MVTGRKERREKLVQQREYQVGKVNHAFGRGKADKLQYHMNKLAYIDEQLQRMDEWEHSGRDVRAEQEREEKSRENHFSQSMRDWGEKAVEEGKNPELVREFMELWREPVCRE